MERPKGWSKLDILLLTELSSKETKGITKTRYSFHKGIIY